MAEACNLSKMYTTSWWCHNLMLDVLVSFKQINCSIMNKCNSRFSFCSHCFNNRVKIFLFLLFTVKAVYMFHLEAAQFTNPKFLSQVRSSQVTKHKWALVKLQQSWSGETCSRLVSAVVSTNWTTPNNSDVGARDTQDSAGDNRRQSHHRDFSFSRDITGIRLYTWNQIVELVNYRTLVSLFYKLFALLSPNRIK